MAAPPGDQVRKSVRRRTDFERPATSARRELFSAPTEFGCSEHSGGVLLLVGAANRSSQQLEEIKMTTTNSTPSAPVTNLRDARKAQTAAKAPAKKAPPKKPAPAKPAVEKAA